MSVLSYGCRRAIASAPSYRILHHARRSFASRIDIPFTPPPVPVIEGCPAPTCQCRETPEGLVIEREQNINGSMAAYAEQILISTGRSDWPSKIDEEEGPQGAFVRQLRNFLLRGGKYVDVGGFLCKRSSSTADGFVALSQRHAHQLLLSSY